jgi:hypothetical protein
MAGSSMRNWVAALVAAGVVVVGPTTTAIAMPSWTAPVTITDPGEIGEFGALNLDPATRFVVRPFKRETAAIAAVSRNRGDWI